MCSLVSPHSPATTADVTDSLVCKEGACSQRHDRQQAEHAGLRTLDIGMSRSSAHGSGQPDLDIACARSSTPRQ